MIPHKRKQVGGDGDLGQLVEPSAMDAQLRTQLETIMRSLKVFEERIDAIERMLSRSGMEPAAPRFPQFRMMPPEIRHQIWSLTMPTRVLCLRESNKSVPIPTLRPPTAAATCREARAVATMHGGMLSLTSDDSSGSTNAVKTYWTWFDCRHDVLELERWVSIEADHPRGIKALAQIAQNILAPRADSAWFARLFAEAASLRRVSLKFDTFLVSRCEWGPDVVRDFFDGVNRMALLDLEDASEIARAKSVLGEHWRCPFFCDFDLAGWAAARRPAAALRAVRDEDWMRRLERTWMSEVARGWVMAKAKPAAAVEAAESEARSVAKAAAMDVKDARVRTALEALPDVRLVRAYVLADVHKSEC